MSKPKQREYSEAERIASALGLKNQAEWRTFSKSGKRPTETPGDPRGFTGISSGTGASGWASGQSPTSRPTRRPTSGLRMRRNNRAALRSWITTTAP